MPVETFRAATMAEALSQVKRRFGREAMILQTRTLGERGLPGLLRGRTVEITASDGTNHLPVAARPDRLPRRHEPIAVAEGAVEKMSGVDMPGRSVRETAPGLSAELVSIKSAVGDLLRETRRLRTPELPEPLQDAYQSLIEQQVAQDIASDLVRRLQSESPEREWGDRAAVRAKLASFVEGMLPAAGPVTLVSGGGPTVVAFVGPSGAGKTTTIAKLAANYRLRHRRSVGLITTDVQRIAAVDQLKTYASVIKVPVETASSVEQMRRAVRKLRSRNIVLIDTVGCSANDEKGLEQLGALLGGADPHEVHLVLASTMCDEVVSLSIERFKRVKADRLVFTKLDEAVGFGVILNCLSKVDARLSYVTAGPNVPDDIAVGRASRLARLIVAGSNGRTGRALTRAEPEVAVT